jgi:hypothetical protein
MVDRAQSGLVALELSVPYMTKEREEIDGILRHLSANKAGPAEPKAPPHLHHVSPAQQRRLARQQKLFFSAGAALLILGAVLLLQACLYPKPVKEEPEAPTDELIGTAEGDALQAQSVSRENRFPHAETLARVPQPAPPDHQREQAQILERLTANGKPPRLMSPGDLRPVLKKGPVNVYCLLVEPLDPVTAESWSHAGLLRLETDVPSPYLRFVTIENEQQLQMLYDDHVEGVTTDPVLLTPRK